MLLLVDHGSGHSSRLVLYWSSSCSSLCPNTTITLQCLVCATWQPLPRSIRQRRRQRQSSTADWLAEFLPDWQAVVYVTDRTSDDPVSLNASLISPHHLPVNKGREASVYLTYIIRHYHFLPDYVVFIHGKRYQIHNGKPVLDDFARLQAQLLTEFVQMTP